MQSQISGHVMFVLHTFNIYANLRMFDSTADRNLTMHLLQKLLFAVQVTRFTGKPQSSRVKPSEGIKGFILFHHFCLSSVWITFSHTLSLSSLSLLDVMKFSGTFAETS